MLFGLCGAKVFEYQMIFSLKIKLNYIWNFWRNWNVPSMLERSWWAGFPFLFGCSKNLYIHCKTMFTCWVSLFCNGFTLISIIKWDLSSINNKPIGANNFLFETHCFSFFFYLVIFGNKGMGVSQYNEPMMWILITDGLTNQTNVKEQYFLFLAKYF
jgi:hypothetical protein